MTRLLIALAATTFLTACQTAAPVRPEAMPVVATPAAEVSAPRAQIGSFGFDSAGMDRSVNAGDNFYQFANGAWAKNTPIPADKSNYGSFNTLDDLSKTRTHEILDEAAKDNSSKIGSAYAAFLDTSAIETKGLTPINPWLGEISALRSKAGLAALTTRRLRFTPCR